MRSGVIARVVVGAAGLAVAPMAVAQSFQGLGRLNGYDSEAMGVSGDGLVVVGQSAVAFRWTAAGGMVAIGPAGTDSVAEGVSRDGSVVAGYFDPGGLESFRWTASGGPVGLGMAPFVDLTAPYNTAYAVSGDGTTIVGTTSSNDPANSDEAFRWTAAGGFERLSGRLPRYVNVEGYGVSRDGSVIVGRGTLADGSGWEGYRWTAGSGMMGLGDLNGDPAFQSSTAAAVSADGAMVVGFSDAPGFFDEAFRWTAAGGMEGLGALPTQFGAGSQALAVNGDGSVVVGWSYGADGHVAFIWDRARGMRALRDVLVEQGLGAAVDGWVLREAVGVSEDGLTIVGTATNPGLGTEAWIARLAAPAVCYANCDGSTATPVLNVNDFLCFQTRFAAGDSWANCDGSTSAPVLNVNDFLCFMGRFAGGCQ